MTVTTPDALAIRAASTAGRGLTLPIAKALAHLMLVNEAIEAGWDISRDTARGEIREAVEHLSTLYYGEDLITEDLQSALDEWTTDLTDFNQALTLPDEGTLHDGDLITVRTIITQCWALLTLIDRELTGLSMTLTDPGTRP